MCAVILEVCIHEASECVGLPVQRRMGRILSSKCSMSSMSAYGRVSCKQLCWVRYRTAWSQLCLCHRSSRVTGVCACLVQLIFPAAPVELELGIHTPPCERRSRCMSLVCISGDSCCVHSCCFHLVLLHPLCHVFPYRGGPGLCHKWVVPSPIRGLTGASLLSP